MRAAHTAGGTAPAAGAAAIAEKAAALFAVDPAGLGGVVVRASAGPVRERWLAHLKRYLPADVPIRRVPVHVGESRLLGGLDLTATLSAGRPVREMGLLAEAHGGLLILPMAERLSAEACGMMAAALDHGTVRLERDGFTSTDDSRFGVVALDESLEDEDRPSALLRERLAFEVDLDGLSHRDGQAAAVELSSMAEARRRLPHVRIGVELIRGLTGTAMALGITSLRAPLLAIRAASAAAALAGRDEAKAEDGALAVQLVLAHRAVQLPTPADEEDDSVSPDEPAPDEVPPEEEEPDQADDRPLDDLLLEAALAALPPDLLNALRHNALKGGAAGKAGGVTKAARRGRPAGIRAGRPGDGHRLSVIETLRAAAPWQPIRRGQRTRASSARVEVRPDDFRLIRRKERSRTTAIFAVDASGSSALERLAEAKGAVELLLAECYTRRDQVALLAFRGRTAELLLPPTRSLVRAKRSLASLPGGGGTPLAAGIEAAAVLADAARRRGETPLLVFLTDGRANIDRDGAPGRQQAREDALALARRVAEGGFPALVIDIAARPGPEAAALADALAARYLPLPKADAWTLSAAVTSARAP